MYDADSILLPPSPYLTIISHFYPSSPIHLGLLKETHHFPCVLLFLAFDIQTKESLTAYLKSACPEHNLLCTLSIPLTALSSC
jgi:hypothetical protein